MIDIGERRNIVETKKALPILFLMMFLVMVGFGIIIPVLPFLAEKVGGNPTELGLLMAVYSLMQLFFAPMWGRISDRIGRKPVMMIGIAGLALSFFISAMADSLLGLFVARIVGGDFILCQYANCNGICSGYHNSRGPRKRNGNHRCCYWTRFHFWSSYWWYFFKNKFNISILCGWSSFINYISTRFALIERIITKEKRAQHSDKRIPCGKHSKVRFRLCLFYN